MLLNRITQHLADYKAGTTAPMWTADVAHKLPPPQPSTLIVEKRNKVARPSARAKAPPPAPDLANIPGLFPEFLAELAVGLTPVLTPVPLHTPRLVKGLSPVLVLVPEPVVEPEPAVDLIAEFLQEYRMVVPKVKDTFKTSGVPIPNELHARMVSFIDTHKNDENGPKTMREMSLLCIRYAMDHVDKLA